MRTAQAAVLALLASLFIVATAPVASAVPPNPADAVLGPGAADVMGGEGVPDPDDQPDPREVVERLLGDDADRADPDKGAGDGGFWDWDDVARVGATLGAALTSGYGLAAIALGALSAGGWYLFGGTRLSTPEEVLENDVRSSIYEYVKETTGAHLHQISTDLDLSTTNAVWHLRKLEDAGLVKSKKFNGYRIFYPVEGGIEAQKLSIGVSVLNNDNAQRIFEHLAHHPGKHQRQLARALDINHGTVRWHLRKMRSAEMVVEIKKGNTTKYFPTDLGRRSLAEATDYVLREVEVPAPATPAAPAAAAETDGPATA